MLMEKKILVIDDNETMREGICESLKREGYSVLSFDNGIEAVETYKINRASLAIVDLKMEPIDGLETLKRLKEVNPELESIMISAYGTVNSAVEAMKLGASDFLTKPFSTAASSVLPPPLSSFT